MLALNLLLVAAAAAPLTAAPAADYRLDFENLPGYAVPEEWKLDGWGYEEGYRSKLTSEGAHKGGHCLMLFSGTASRHCRNAAGGYPAGAWLELWKAFGGRCGNCGTDGDVIVAMVWMRVRVRGPLPPKVHSRRDTLHGELPLP